MNSNLPPPPVPGWYPDPLNATTYDAVRWWDGRTWTDYIGRLRNEMGRETFGPVPYAKIAWVLGALIVVSGVIGLGLPYFFASSPAAPNLLLVLVSLLLDAVTIAALFVIGRYMSWGLTWTVLASVVNVCVISILFLIEPLSILSHSYLVRYFTGGTYLSNTTQTGMNPTMGAFEWISCISCIEFLAVFSVLYIVYRHTVKRAIAASNDGVNPYLPRDTRNLVVVLVLMVVLYLMSGFDTNATMFSGIIKPVMPLIDFFFLASALASVLAFLALRDRSVRLRSLSAITGYFWIAGTLIVVEHILWVLFLGVVTSLWPLHVTISSYTIPSSK